MYEIAVTLILFSLHIRLYNTRQMPEAGFFIHYCFDVVLFFLLGWLFLLLTTVLTMIGGISKLDFLRVVRKVFFLNRQ